MKFSGSETEDVNISLTPLVDIVFLLLIFFMVSTTFSTESQLRLRLPSSDRVADTLSENQQLLIDISQFGQYAIRRPGEGTSRDYGSGDPQELAALLRETAADWRDPVVVIRADRRTSHESVITVLDATRRAGFMNVTFALQSESEQ